MAKYVVESIGSEKQEIEATSVVAGADWIMFHANPDPYANNVVAAFPTAQVFRVIPG